MPTRAILLSPTFLDFIAKFISRLDVESVSCPYEDEALWRILVAEQLRRAARTGLHPQHAFALSGPDGGLTFDPADWGGYLHTPYEGAADADFFMLPLWRGVDLRAGMGEQGSLLRVNLYKPCHHLLVRGVHQDLNCATKTLVDGEWTLYTSRLAYEPVNPFGGASFAPGERSPPPVAFRD